MKYEPLKDWKTRLTGAVAAVFNALAGFGVLEVSPDVVEAVNGALVGLIAIFLHLKLSRTQ